MGRQQGEIVNWGGCGVGRRGERCGAVGSASCQPTSWMLVKVVSCNPLERKRACESEKGEWNEESVREGGRERISRSPLEKARD